MIHMWCMTDMCHISYDTRIPTYVGMIKFVKVFYKMQVLGAQYTLRILSVFSVLWIFLCFFKGIYRISSVKSRVEQVWHSFEFETSVDISDQPPNIIANVLKLYLRQVSEQFTFLASVVAIFVIIAQIWSFFLCSKWVRFDHWAFESS